MITNKHKFTSIAANMCGDKWRAKHIQKTLGTKVAAGYLRNRNYSVEFAVLVLTGKF